jgi:hypothetical protein
MSWRKLNRSGSGIWATDSDPGLTFQRSKFQRPTLTPKVASLFNKWWDTRDYKLLCWDCFKDMLRIDILANILRAWSARHRTLVMSACVQLARHCRPILSVSMVDDAPDINASSSYRQGSRQHISKSYIRALLWSQCPNIPHPSKHPSEHPRFKHDHDHDRCSCSELKLL